MKKTTLIKATLLASCMVAFAKEPLIIEKQGNFFAGGIVVQNSGEFDGNKMSNRKALGMSASESGQTIHADHAAVSYQIPQNARKYSLTFLHGFGQSAYTWTTTPDGREGFDTIFLRDKYSVYLVDQPRRGRAGQSSIGIELKALAQDQMWFNTFRVGIYPNYFDGVQFSKDEKALNHYFRQMTPNTGTFDEHVISDTIAKSFEVSGDGILITHSQGGGPGWWSAIKSSKIKVIATYEPGSGFLFPQGETPKPIQGTSSSLSAMSITLEEFKKLTKIPIVIYYGDFIPNTPSNNPAQDSWRIRLEMAKLWVETVNKYGGNAKVIHLPEIGIKGNTHFPFSDLNNEEIANLLKSWLKENGLDRF